MKIHSLTLIDNLLVKVNAKITYCTLSLWIREQEHRDLDAL